MNFTITDELQTTPERAWALYFDPDFNLAMQERLLVESFSEFEYEETPDHIRMVYRVVVRRTLPDWVKKVLGDFKVSYTATDVFDKKKLELRSTMKTDAMPTRIYGGGLWTVKPSRPGHVIRRYDGEIHIDIPLVGGKMEQKLAKSLEHDFAISNQILQEWVQRDLEDQVAGRPLRALKPAQSLRARV